MDIDLLIACINRMLVLSDCRCCSNTTEEVFFSDAPEKTADWLKKQAKEGNFSDAVDFMPGGIVILDARSGYGKTTMLLKLKNKLQDQMLISSCETLVAEMVECIKREKTQDIYKHITSKKVFAIEDIDILHEKIFTLKKISDLINAVSDLKSTTVIITGTDIYEKMPQFIDSLKETIYLTVG